ncbi:hypothetical protein [uncultured Duncaniella sp.]|mgnify:CR=1 FL=1|uniref:hypothetical protein n=1 Tax=uncultured Duncaniella sp. TaxID=2768039 RepID=UPI0026012A73|nr:hypothetical protein [uncultured Duncaniella sp.]
MAKGRGISYQMRVADINRIYDLHAKSGLSNREIWRRFIYPVYGISERSFYNIMNATAGPDNPVVASDMPSLFDLLYDENQKNDPK